MRLKYILFKFKQKLYRNFTTNDLKPGVKIKWYKGISTIKKVSTSYSMFVMTGNEPIDFQPETCYILDTNYYFDDEPDIIFEKDILKIIKEGK